MSGPKLKYTLREHGWATLDLEIEGRSLCIESFGDCRDGLGDLVRAALAIASRSYREVVRLDGEPTEWRLILQRDWESPRAETLKVSVLEFGDIYADAPDEAGVPLFEARCPADEFAAAVLRAATEVWSAFGEDGYVERWRLEGFPLRGMKALETALATKEAKMAHRFG